MTPRAGLRAAGWGVLLAAFALPWFSVSCAGQPVVDVTGMALVTDGVDLSGLETAGAAMAAAANVRAQAVAELLLWRMWAGAIAALACLGMLLTLMGRWWSARLAAGMAWLSFLLLAIGWPVGWGAPRRIAAAAGSGSGGTGGFEAGDPMLAAVVEGLVLTPRTGYWLALGAAAAVAILGFGRRPRAIAPASATPPAAPSPLASGPPAPPASALPGMFGRPVVAVYRAEGGGWRLVVQVDVAEGRGDLGAVAPGLAPAFLGRRGGRVWLEAPAAPAAQLLRQGRWTTLRPVPPRMVLWPADQVSLGDWRLVMHDGP